MARIEKEVAEELHAYLTLGAMTWATRDPHCAGVLNDQAKEMADRFAKILARNPRLLERMRGAGVIGDWVGLATAVLPVLKAVHSHHVAQIDPEEGTSALDAYAPYQPGGRYAADAGTGAVGGAGA